MEEVEVVWLGRVEYRVAWALQEELRRLVLAGEGRETILLLEHPKVVTLGRSSDPAHVLLDEAALAARGVDRVVTSRGGDVTYHGPGQLVAYPVVRIGRGVVAHVEGMARAVIETVRPLGIDAVFRRERAGVWVGDRKLAAFGVHVSRRVAIHGLALNVTTPSSDFAVIVPCGLHDAGVTSIADLTGHSEALDVIAPRLGIALATALGRSPRALERREIASPIASAAPAVAGPTSPSPGARIQPLQRR
ncbi:MAG: lipoyl(octanoyl) transferase LipB [Myxococcales bacterium]|nr:lipoyl(octanoyl) transferase LipB [Myxococcales bacterium]